MTDDHVLACPNCDKTDIQRRTGNGNAYVGDPNDRYACYKCGTSFNDPVRRKAREWTPGYKPTRTSSEPTNLSVSNDLIERVRAATDPP